MRLNQELKLNKLDRDGVQIVSIDGGKKVCVPLSLDADAIKKELFSVGFLVATKGRDGSSFVYYIKADY